jgi:hypothetical protein
MRDLQAFGQNVSSVMQREFESKFDTLLAEKINESWGAQGFNTAIDDMRSELFLISRDLKDTRGDLEKYRRERNQSFIDEIIGYVDETVSRQENEIQRSVSVIASAVLALHDRQGQDLQEAVELASSSEFRLKPVASTSPKSLSLRSVSSPSSSSGSPPKSSSPGSRPAVEASPERKKVSSRRVTFQQDETAPPRSRVAEGFEIPVLDTSSSIGHHSADTKKDEQKQHYEQEGSLDISSKEFDDFVVALNLKKEKHRLAFRGKIELV